MQPAQAEEVKKRGTDLQMARLVAKLALLALLLLSQPLEGQSKTHHSKRQAQLAQPNNSQPAATGRENTNWWNLWWQQYIDEAVQPTVRPIVAVSFAGKTIGLPAESTASEPANNRDQRDVESNFVLAGGPAEGGASFELERQAGLQPKQALLVERKSQREQTNWRMVQPTIIRAQTRDSRQNRQTVMFRPNEVDVGIQMRASMNRAMQQRRQQMADINQTPMEFEQQQNQMVDYTEEAEPELDNSIQGGGAQQGAVDSSSSSMMMVPVARKTTSGGEMRTSQRPESSPPTRRPAAGMPQRGPTQSGAGGQQLPVDSSTQLTGRGEEARSEPATTFAPPTSTKAAGTQMGEVDVNETPISLDANQQQGPASTPAAPQTTSKTTTGSRAPSSQSGSTPPAGRVELQNGRPASGMRQQQATTTSARLPALPGQTRAMMTSTSQAPSSSSTASSTTTGGSRSTSGVERAEETGSSTTSSPNLTGSSIASGEPASSSSGRDDNEQFTTTTATSVAGTGNNSEFRETGPGRQTTPSVKMTSSGGDKTTPAPSTSNRTEPESDEDDEDEETDGGLLKTNAEGADESDENETDGDEEEDQASSTSSPGSADLQKVTTSSPTEAMSKTTQQSTSMTTMELERLTAGEGAGSTTTKQDSMLMMTLKPVDREGGSEGGISMPMETLMKMIQNQVAMEENERLQTTTTASPMRSTATSGESASSRLMMKGENKMTPQTARMPEEPVMTTLAVQTSSKGNKLQPPPTTKMPVASTSGQAKPTTTSTTTTATGRDEQPAGQVELLTSTTPKTISLGKEADEEAKIELLNLDLMPIRKMMGSSQQQQQDREEGGGKKVVLMMQSPVRPGSQEQKGVSGGSEGEQTRQKTMEQVMVMNVEPGMRLRPPMAGGPQTQQFEQSAPEVGPRAGQNTVYMIMMNNGRQQPVIVTSTAVNGTAHSKKPAGFSPAPQAKTSESKQTTIMPKQSTTAQMSRTTSGQVVMVSPVMRASTSGKTTPASQTATSSSQQQAVSSQMGGSSGSGPASSMSSGSNLAQQAQTEEAEKTTTKGSGERVTFKMEEATQTISSIGESTTTTTPRSSSVSQSANSANSNPTSSEPLPTTTSAPVSSSPSPARQDQEEARGTQSTTPATSTTTVGNKQRQQGGGDQSGRLQQQQQQSSGSIKRPQTKTGKPSNATSSFIPSKLRMDFNKTAKLQQPANATELSGQKQVDEPAGKGLARQGFAQNMAIRQFGGANRMSALANQPVPFGRPAAMTMPPSGERAPPSKFEVPTFEYGPSIAVRRPDEPLANGQMPNCTLAGKNFCVLTKDYPMNEVRQAVERSFRSVRIMYEELQTVSDQELHKDDFNATNNQAASGKFACQTQVEMMRPGWAKDEITKEWMLVVNTDVFPQRVRTESCAQPNTPCEFIAPFYDSTCQQRYSLHRMIAIDPHDPSRSPQVAVFKFPAGCVCRVHPIKKSITTSTTSAM